MTTDTTGRVLMEVLDRLADPEFQQEVQEVTGDGTRPPLWQMRFELNHSIPATAPTWLAELEHSYMHVMAAPDATGLRAALVQHAALTAAWIQNIDGRDSDD